MIVDYIAYYSAEEILPYSQYHSGVKEDKKAIYRFAHTSDSNPILVLEEDIISPNGKGLKRGFYQVLLNEDCTFFLLRQSDELKAKIPVVSVSQRKDVEPVEQKPTKKKQKKNYKGGDSSNFIHTKAELRYDSENDCYVLFYEHANTKATGIIKF